MCLSSVPGRTHPLKLHACSAHLAYLGNVRAALAKHGAHLKGGGGQRAVQQRSGHTAGHRQGAAGRMGARLRAAD